MRKPLFPAATGPQSPEARRTLSRAARAAQRRMRGLPVLAPRNMELLGVRNDAGDLALWDTGDVQPISKFPRAAGGIQPGHYVLFHRGGAVTAHCSNGMDGEVRVQLMCSSGNGFCLPEQYVEDMLLGRVIPDPVAEAEMRAALERLRVDQERKHDAPHRRRGRLGGQ